MTLMEVQRRKRRRRFVRSRVRQMHAQATEFASVVYQVRGEPRDVRRRIWD